MFSSRLLVSLAATIVCSVATAQCEDSLACNYQPGTTGTAECVYFDTDLFTLEEQDWIQQLNFDACETGYWGSSAMAVSLELDSINGGLYFNLSEETIETLDENGYGPLANDLQTVTAAVCGSTMHWVSGAGTFDIEFDGTGFIHPFWGGFIAPESSFPEGCSIWGACNFDACVLPGSWEGCEFLEASDISGDTLTMVGEPIVLTYNGLEGSYLDWWSSCGDVVSEEGSMDAVLDPDSEGACAVCLVEFTADGCVTDSTCIDITVQAFSDVRSPSAEWLVSPNPAQHNLTLTWTSGVCEVAVLDRQGRIVLTQGLSPGANSIDVSALDAGLYFVSPEGTTPRRFVVLR